MELLKNSEYKNTQCIYKIANSKTGKVYIGSTVRLQQRINSHVRKLTEGNHLNSDLQKDWNKYGKGSFAFSVIQLVENKEDLQLREKEQIDIYTCKKGVYNKSNPLEEAPRGRRPKRDKGYNRVGETYKYSQKYIVEWLNNKFGKLADTMKGSIEERLYFDKSKVDEWIMEKITAPDIKNDSRINGLLNRWYGKIGFSIVDVQIYRSTFWKLYKANIEINGDILVTKEVRETVHKEWRKRYRKSYIKK